MSAQVFFKPNLVLLMISLALTSTFARAGTPDELSTFNKADSATREAEIKGAAAVVAGAPKTPAVKTITNFTQALRCMDELFLQYGKQGIVVTSAGIPDATGKAQIGSKEMLITALSKMTLKSHAFDFIDFHSAQDDLGKLFEQMGGGVTRMPDYYIRGSVTQMDDNTVRKNKGMGIALPFLDLGYSKDESFDVLSMDMSVGEAASRRILPETATSNTMILVKGGRSGEAGGRLGKAGLSFNLDLSRSEGVGAASRTLIELGLIESLGKFTRVPYWKCLDIDSTNPAMMGVARDWYETAKEKDRVLFVQRKLAGMGRYNGPIDGLMNGTLNTAIAEYQSAAGLIADGRLNFELYYSLLDDTQNQLAALPTTPQKRPDIPAHVAAPAPIVNVQGVSQTSTGERPSAAFAVHLDSDRGDKPSYRVGEFLNMKLSLSAAGTVYCYYQDVSRATARIFPNQFFPNSMMNPGSTVMLPSGGFKIRFDRPGRERVACVGSDREIVPPASLIGTRDLTPLQVGSVDEVVAQFKKANPSATASFIDITVR